MSPSDAVQWIALVVLVIRSVAVQRQADRLARALGDTQQAFKLVADNQVASARHIKAHSEALKAHAGGLTRITEIVTREGSS